MGRKWLKAALMLTALLPFSDATAKTGAELLQDPEMFGMGFVWGAANYMVEDYALNDDVGNRLTMHRGKCLSDAGITAKTLYDAVIQEIRTDPSTLSRPATLALVGVVFKVCGPPK